MSLTINNTKAFSLDGEIGAIETGEKANLSLLNKNPLVDIMFHNSIESIIFNGNLVDISKLFALRN